jgi:hypothetical protein
MRAAPRGNPLAVVLATVIGGALVVTVQAAAPAAQAPSESGREGAVRAVMAVADDYVAASTIRNPVRAAALGLPNPRHNSTGCSAHLRKSRCYLHRYAGTRRRSSLASGERGRARHIDET